jgi:hypothetical protein
MSIRRSDAALSRMPIKMESKEGGEEGDVERLRG